MARPDRLFRLLQAMRVMAPPITAARLAEEMEVSLRSLYRDIDSLRAAGARIEGERGYGYRLVEDYALPPQSFDRTEIEAIALGLAEVQSMVDPALAKAAKSALAKSWQPFRMIVNSNLSTRFPRFIGPMPACMQVPKST